MTELVANVETTPNISIVACAPSYPDPDALFASNYHSDNVGTWMSAEWLQSPLLDQLIDQERVTGEKEKRMHIMNIIQQIIVEDCPDIFMDNMIVRNAMQNYVMGLTYRSGLDAYYFHDFWFEK